MKLGNPQITLISATFNADKTLSDLIDSIRSQSFKDFEFIIIDGGSSDDTLNIIKSNLDLIDYWISEKDDGIYDAWNKGILYSHGKWISFVGADDILKPDAMQVYSEIIKNISSQINFISGKAEVYTRREYSLNVIGSTYHPIYINVCHVLALHKASLFKKHGNFNTKYKIVGDYEFLLRCRKNVNPLFIPKVIVQVGNAGVSNSYSAIKEIFKARIEAGINPFVVAILFVWNLFIYTFNLPRKIINNK